MRLLSPVVLFNDQEGRKSLGALSLNKSTKTADNRQEQPMQQYGLNDVTPKHKLFSGSGHHQIHIYTR